MSRKYKFRDNNRLYFVTLTVNKWIDVFTRNEYKDIILNSLKYCQAEKGLEIYCYCIMTNHLHMIIGTSKCEFSDILRDLKKIYK